ncbi:MAG: AI-2E family transporter [Actinobacteria bacterium]|nr:AI-2E family transporter [Actinomycetota bacterium]
MCDASGLARATTCAARRSSNLRRDAETNGNWTAGAEDVSQHQTAGESNARPRRSRRFARGTRRRTRSATRWRRQGREFADSVPDLLRHGGSLAAKTFRRLNQDELGRRVRDSITDYLNENAGSLSDQLSRFAQIGLRLANFAVTTIIGLILGIYGLLALPRMGAAFARVVPAAQRAHIAPVSLRVREVFSGYLRARLIVSIVVGGLATLGLWLIGMPFWLLLGLVVGFANLIPMLGSFIGGIPVLLVAVLTKSPLSMLATVGILMAAHAVDGYILSPVILRETTDLHPVVVLLAVLIGGATLGLWGVLAAVPVAGAFQAIGSEFLKRHRERKEAEAAATTPA